MKQKKFQDITEYNHDGLVFIDTSEPTEWGHGIIKMLIESRIVKNKECFEKPFFVKTKNNRIDTVIPFAEHSKIRMPKLVGWKQMVSNIFGTSYWIYDYIDKMEHEHDK